MNAFVLYIGYFGPSVLLFSSVLLTLTDKVVLGELLVGTGINHLLNAGLKQMFRDQRPSPRYHYISTSDFVEKTTHVHELGLQEYGMPSGHAQHVWFFTSFIYYFVEQPYATLFFTCISVITCMQRVIYKNHTLLQVIIGGVVGILFGYLWHVILSNPLLCNPLSSFSDA